MKDLAAVSLPTTIKTKVPEGYAFYSLYPEAYLEAAASISWAQPPVIIGLRSIGTGLAAMVAVASNAAPPMTVRPIGHPFDRKLSISSTFRAELFADSYAAYAVVDEGPGLSGSSFGAVADLLEEQGVTPERIVFFPSHRGELGAIASTRRRVQWSCSSRSCLDFEQVITPLRLARFAADITGSPIAPLEDLSGGAWRRPGSNDPVCVQQERRKFRLRSRSDVYLLKFVGLGQIGEAKFMCAKALYAAGFSPEPLGLCHGFLVERWLDAHPINRRPMGRDRLLHRLANYLRFRSEAFPAADTTGADLSLLMTMTRHNLTEALGTSIAEALLEPFDFEVLKPLVRRVVTDNRLHSWEWLEMPDGTILKTDALDHCQAHDLVGCQDIAWDVAGASVEFDLAEEEVVWLCGVIDVDTDLLAAMRLAYLAFQIGLWTMAASTADASEQCRIATLLERYRLRILAAQSGPSMGYPGRR